MRTIIAISGRSGAGKDAAADALCRSLAFKNVKFAAPLKDAAATLFGIPHECFCDNLLKDQPHPALLGSTPRSALQWLGTDVMQHGLIASGLMPGIGRGFWANRLVEMIDHLPTSADRIVVSDMRFQHELDCLRKRYGHRLLAIRLVRPMQQAQHDHESEKCVDLLDVPIVIQNDKSLDEFQDAIVAIAKLHIEDH